MLPLPGSKDNAKATIPQAFAFTSFQSANPIPIRELRIRKINGKCLNCPSLNQPAILHL
jgi:hypothetical protein